jgi:adenylate cyclase
MFMTAPIQDFARPPAGTVYSGAVAALVLGEGRFIRDIRQLIASFAEALRTDGVMLDYLVVVFATLHPQVRALHFVWRSDRREIEERAVGWKYTEEYYRSPFFPIHQGTHDVIRRRLADPNTPRDFGVLWDLDAEGFSDYLIASQKFSNPQRIPGAVSISTHLPGGFTDEMLSRFLASQALIAPLIDSHLSERIASTLLDVYVGPNAGQRILAGAIRRGDGETIPAAICFADLRSFTTLSDRLPRQELLELLNAFFECVVDSIHAHGGEVLKFIGDAVLAIFRASPGHEKDASRAALASAQQIFLRANELNPQRKAAGKESIEFGMAIHFGEVMYGNIGSNDRLDFTVIGPAVNVCSRIQGLCGRLDRSLLLSKSLIVTAECQDEVDDMGAHELKGVSSEVHIFAPRAFRN